MSFTLLTFEDRCRIRELAEREIEKNRLALQVAAVRGWTNVVGSFHDDIIRDETLIQRLSLD